MSIAVLVQVHEEVRRLAIAGGAVASGDFRLKKLVPPLEQAGAKAPVFGRVAQAATAVVESNEKTASAALLELASLVNAILYTQGATGIAGELAELETTDLGTRGTQTSARVLKPLLDALNSTGSGRLELVKDAVERGTFKDLRLVKPAVNALEDPYPEIADLIAKKVLPLYGKAIIPELKAELDLKGRGGNLFRLRLLHTLDPEGTRETVKLALDEGSKEIRVVAIECLGTTGDDLSYLLEQAKAKAKDVRAAALRALSGAGTAAAEVIGALKKAIDGADLELIVDQLKKSTLPEVLDYVLAQADRQLNEALAEKDVKKQGPAVGRFMRLLRCLQGRSEARVEAFVLRCFEAVPVHAKIKSAPSGQDLNELLAHVMLRGTPKMQKTLAAAHATLSGGMLPAAYDAARETMSAKAFFEEFSPILAGLKSKSKKSGGDLERAWALATGLAFIVDPFGFRMSRNYHEYESDEGRTRSELDPRWLDAAIDADAVELVCELARPGHARTNKFLLERLESTKIDDQHQLMRTMARIGHPATGDVVVELLKKHAKAAHHIYYSGWLGQLIVQLPRSEYPKFEALLPTLPEKMVDRLIESIEELKNKTE